MAVTQWQTMLRECLLKRIPPEELVKLTQRRERVNVKAVFNSLLACRHSFCAPGDPLPSRYLEALLLADVVTLADALLAFVTRWNASTPKTSSSAEIASLQEMTMLIASQKLAPNVSETRRCLLLSSRWLTAIVHATNHESNQVDPSVGQLLEACGSLLVTFAGTNAGVALLSKSRHFKGASNTSIFDVVGHAIELGIGLFATISTQLMERLGIVQKHIAMVSHGESQPDVRQQEDVQVLQFHANVTSSQLMASRAGTFAYIGAMVFTGKTIEDTTLYNFLEGRHSNNYNSMFLDILFASFQSLQKALVYGQPFFDHARIFIRNKLPSTLSAIASSPFATFTSEQALSDAWPQLGSELSTPELVTCGHHFLHVCFLTQLVSAEKRDQLIGDAAAKTTFSKTLQSKEDVVAEVNNGHTRPAMLIEQLVQTDGSAAAIAQAIVEMILTYCQNKETHHLKDLANAMVRKPEAINALALFIRPSYWLSPLCSLLDEWRWDEIHGESQPLYDEFGGVLLLITMSKRRLLLSKSDIGSTNQGGFVSRYLDQEGIEQAVSDLSEDSQRHLGEWIDALYVAESLNDELTTSCSPQEFYLFIPTLLRQSLLALQSGKLSQETLNSGLEFLLEPFLLPSLVSATSWINSASDVGARSSVLPVFTKSPNNSEAQDIHETIMTMTGSASQFAFNQKLAPSLELFQQNSISSIVNVAAVSILSTNLVAIVESHGLAMAFKLMLEILLHFSGTADFLTALDVTATMVCTADRQLRDLLRLKYTTLGSLLKKNQTLLAEAIVHLHRRVEDYASVLMVQDIGMDQFATLQLSNIDAVAANMEVPAQATQEIQQHDQPMDDIDQVLNESAVMGSIEQVDPAGLNMDDFYGLQGDMGNLDDLDLEMFS